MDVTQVLSEKAREYADEAARLDAQVKSLLAEAHKYQAAIEALNGKIARAPVTRRSYPAHIRPPGTVKQAILKALTSGRNGARQIAEATGIQKNHISVALTTMARSGTIRRVDKGLYALPPTGVSNGMAAE